ncbi:hypothetical protein D3C87_1507860 [compost metagenome]
MAPDIAGGGIDPFGQAAHFTGHYRETAPRVPCPGGFHARVQGQQLRLQRDVLDQLADLGHRTRTQGQLAHHVGKRGHLAGHAVYARLHVGQF